MKFHGDSQSGAGRSPLLIAVALLVGLGLLVAGGVTYFGKSTLQASAEPAPTSTPTTATATGTPSSVPTGKPVPQTSYPNHWETGHLPRETDAAGRTISPAQKLIVSLKLPNVDSETPVEVGVADPATGQLFVPADGQALSWYPGSASPGDATGPVLIAGHKDTKTSSGVFSKLAGLVKGDRITVTTADGRELAYRMTERTSYNKSADKSTLPSRLYGKTGKHELALVTCGGVWDPKIRAYPENFVIYASPA